MLNASAVYNDGSGAITASYTDWFNIATLEAPSYVTAYPMPGTGFQISWQQGNAVANDFEIGYSIQRSEFDPDEESWSDWATLDTVAQDINAYFDPINDGQEGNDGVLPDVTYRYRVIANANDSRFSSTYSYDTGGVTMLSLTHFALYVPDIASTIGRVSISAARK